MAPVDPPVQRGRLGGLDQRRIGRGGVNPERPGREEDAGRGAGGADHRLDDPGREAVVHHRLAVPVDRDAVTVGGKIAGTYFTGAAQMFILIILGSLAFQIHWGGSLAVVLLTLALVAAATSWGMLIAAYSRTSGQAATLGTAVVLIFAGLAGNFVPRQLLPQWLQTASYISPNAWGLEGFMKLAGGSPLTDILGPLAALLSMAIVLFGLALLAFRRQYT